MKARLAALTAGMALAWAAASYPAYRSGGGPSLACSLAAMLLCLLPGLAVVAWSGRVGTTPHDHMKLMVGGTLARMACCLLGGLTLFLTGPLAGRFELWFWLLGFYLVALALETALVTRRATGDERPRA